MPGNERMGNGDRVCGTEHWGEDFVGVGPGRLATVMVDGGG